MSQNPILHHEARGIHPGAFVQPAEPVTTGLQDGVLWVDTSTPPPFQLRCWRAVPNRWMLVGLVAGLPSAQPGDMLVYGPGGWYLLPPGVPGDTLQEFAIGQYILPQWAQGCCGTVAKSLPNVPGKSLPGGAANSEVRCGAALSMASWLEHYYANIKTAIVWGLTILGGVTLAFLFDWLIAALSATEIVLPGIVNWVWIEKAANFILLHYGVSNAFPTLTSDDDAAILKAIYCALPAAPGSLVITDAVLTQWQDNIDRVHGALPGLSGGLLEILIGVPSLAQWQILANNGTGAQSPVCAGFDCGASHSMQGGAQIGLLLRRSMQGGATFGTHTSRSRQGGAQLV